VASNQELKRSRIPIPRETLEKHSIGDMLGISIWNGKRVQTEEETSGHVKASTIISLPSSLLIRGVASFILRNKKMTQKVRTRE
jgi:hypothetical protein